MQVCLALVLSRFLRAYAFDLHSSFKVPSEGEPLPRQERGVPLALRRRDATAAVN
jgi:hypothetical protein